MTQNKKEMSMLIYMTHEIPVTRPPQPRTEQQADEGEDCQGLADHLVSNSLPHSGHRFFEPLKS